MMHCVNSHFSLSRCNGLWTRRPPGSQSRRTRGEKWISPTARRSHFKRDRDSADAKASWRVAWGVPAPNWLGTASTRGDPSPLRRTAIPTGTGTRTTRRYFRAAAGPPQPRSSAPADRFRLVLLHPTTEQRPGAALLCFVRRRRGRPRSSASGSLHHWVSP